MASNVEGIQTRSKGRTRSESSVTPGIPTNIPTNIPADPSTHPANSGYRLVPIGALESARDAMTSLAGTASHLSQSLSSMRADVSSAAALRTTQALGTPLSSSTAAGTPSGRGTAAEMENSTEYIRTPFGGSIHHNLQSQHIFSPNRSLPEHPSKVHIEAVIANLKMKMDFFTMNCQNQPGWIGQLEATISRFNKEIDEIIIKSRNEAFTDELKEAEEISKTFNETSKNLREAAGIQNAQDQNMQQPIPNLPSTPVNVLQDDNGALASLNLLEEDLNPPGPINPPTQPTQHTIDGPANGGQDSVNTSIEDTDTGEPSKNAVSPRTFKLYRNKLIQLESDWFNNKIEISENVSHLQEQLTNVESREQENNTEVEAIIRRVLQLEEEKKSADKQASSDQAKLIDRITFLEEDRVKTYNLERNEMLAIRNRFCSLEAMVNSTVMAQSKAGNFTSVMQAQLYDLKQSVNRKQVSDLNEKTSHAPLMQGHHGNGMHHAQSRDTTSIPGILAISTTMSSTARTQGSNTASTTVPFPPRMMPHIQTCVHQPLYSPMHHGMSGFGYYPQNSIQMYTSTNPNPYPAQIPASSSTGAQPYQGMPQQPIVEGTREPTCEVQTTNYTVPPRTSREEGPSEPHPQDSDDDGDDDEHSSDNDEPRVRRTKAKLNNLNSALKADAVDLQKKLDPQETSQLSKSVVKQLNKNILPGIENDRRELQSRLDTYSTCDKTRVDKSVFKLVSSSLREARNWCSELRQNYNKMGCGQEPLDKKIHDNLARYARNSDINIFEFLRRFDQMVKDKGSDSEKAELLFERYLTSDLQDEIRSQRNNLEFMKAWLIGQCGDVRDMTRNIISSINKASLPNDKSTRTEVTSYYRKINAALHKIQELRDTKNMPLVELEEYIYSNEFLLKITALMPERTESAFMDKLVIRGLDPFKMRGEEAFNALAATAAMHFKSAFAKEEVESAKTGNHHSKSHPNKTTLSAHHQGSSPSLSNQTDNMVIPGIFDFPCPLTPNEEHNHELGECTKFFKEKKRKNRVWRKLCYCCLGPFYKCRGGRCINENKEKVKRLMCPECVEAAIDQTYSPNNTLICSDNTHTRLPKEELLRQLQAYLTNFDASKMQL